MCWILYWQVLAFHNNNNNKKKNENHFAAISYVLR